MRKRWMAGAAAVVTTVVTAMGAATLVTLGPEAGSAKAAETLTQFDDCRELRAWYVRQALPQVGPWGLDGPSPHAGEPRTAPDDDLPPGAVAERSEAGASEGADAGPVGNGRTGTNVQERGVDEPDLAKTDGQISAVVDDDDLVVSDVTGEEPRELSRTALPGPVGELLLARDRAVLLGRSAPSAPTDSAVPEPGSIRGPDGENAPGPNDARTSITILDLSDPAAPEIVDTRRVDGSYVTAREHAGTVRVVVASQPRLEFVQPGDGVTMSEAEAKNRRIVRESAAQDWLPSVQHADGESEALLGCSAVQRPRDPSGLGATTILTLDPTEPARAGATAVVADGSLVYASARRLYVATMTGGHWGVSAGDAESRRSGHSTQVHAFDTSGEHTSYVATGSVDGTVPDRWAFSAHEGRLRVATMQGDPRRPSETTVSVLEERGDRLEVVGSVGGMGENERIHAVRWFGDLAVVVTFRRVDPLYTVDLGHPQRPRVVGQLKIPGFSEYLHPVGGDLLLGVGQDATRSGRQQGSQVSSFDVADLADPTRVDSLMLGDRGHSSVERDSRAFTYLPRPRLAFVPVGHAATEDAQVAALRVDEDGTLTPAETVPVTGSLSTVRVLPIDGGRIAVVADGAVQQILDPSAPRFG